MTLIEWIEQRMDSINQEIKYSEDLIDSHKMLIYALNEQMDIMRDFMRLALNHQTMHGKDILVEAGEAEIIDILHQLEEQQNNLH